MESQPYKMFRIERLYIAKTLVKNALTSLTSALKVRNIHVVQHPTIGDAMEKEALALLEKARDFLIESRSFEDL